MNHFVITVFSKIQPQRMCWPRTLSWRSDKNTECKMKQNSDEIPDCIVSSLPHNALCTVHRHWWFSREVCPGNWEELWGDHPRDHHLNISIFSCTKKVVSCCKNQNKNTKKFTLYRSWRRKEEKEMQAKRISGEGLGKVMEGSEINAAATTSCFLTMYCVPYNM